MNRLTKRYNENIGMYEYVDSFSGAGIFDSILKGITSKFVKDTATKLGTKALEAGVNKVGSEIGTRAANKVITTVDKKFFKPAPVIVKENPLGLKNSNEFLKPLGNLIVKELNKEIHDKSDDDDDNKLLSSENINKALKKQYYGFGYKNKQFQNKLNKLLK